MINSDTANNNHYALWNEYQQDSYVATAMSRFPEEWNRIRTDLDELGMLTGMNFIQEFLLAHRNLDVEIMEATGLAYVGI